MDTSAQNALQQKLFEAFNEIKARNPAVSLRGFARRLAISPAALSEILRGKRRVSAQRAAAILEKLALDPAEAEKILNLFNAVQGVAAPASAQRAVVQLASDQFNFIAEWQHSAILALAKDPGFLATAEYVSQRLGLTARAAQDALDRLKRLGLLKNNREGAEIQGQGVETTENVKALAARKAGLQNFDLSRAAFDRQTRATSEFMSVALAVAPAQIGAVKAELERFAQNLQAAVLSSGSMPIEIYKLNIQFFQVSLPTQSEQDILAAAPAAAGI